ncbi:alpha/beta hydrolase [Echinicola pacifica]|nr:alpha/beta fold hydrolase [Echinicola pacifica]
MKRIILTLLALISISSIMAQTEGKKPISLQDQGVFAVGGGIIKAEGEYDPNNPKKDGQTLHIDHATIHYQIPINAKKLPLVFWHGFGQTARTWQTTADGREGFQTIFLRKGFSVYLIDQPRRGQGGRGPEETSIPATPNEQYWLGMFRIAKGDEFMPNVKFDKGPETLNQFYRQISPDLGAIDFEVNTNAISALFDKIGDGILITHSHSGGQGWTTAIKNSNIKAIVTYEPGSGFVFPEGEVPDPMESSAGTLEAVPVSKIDFLKLTKIPIIIYYGDFIPETQDSFYGTDNWRPRLVMAKLFVETINKYGGDAKVVHLPGIGIKGNTHFPMSDLNNIEIANLMYGWLNDKGLN